MPAHTLNCIGSYLALFKKIAFFGVLCVSVISAQSSKAPNASMIHFDVKAMDKTANPCADFYQYACGGWLKANPIPADQARWGRFSELEERNKSVLRQILDEAANPAPNRDSTTQKPRARVATP